MPIDKREPLTFPSNNSRLAPPPVLTWLSLSSALYCATTVAVSPPPTITTAPFRAASMLASRRALDPPAKAGNSKTPGGLGSIGERAGKLGTEKLAHSKEWSWPPRLWFGTDRDSFPRHPIPSNRPECLRNLTPSRPVNFRSEVYYWWKPSEHTLAPLSNLSPVM